MWRDKNPPVPPAPHHTSLGWQTTAISTFPAFSWQHEGLLANWWRKVGTQHFHSMILYSQHTEQAWKIRAALQQIVVYLQRKELLLLCYLCSHVWYLRLGLYVNNQTNERQHLPFNWHSKNWSRYTCFLQRLLQKFLYINMYLFHCRQAEKTVRIIMSVFLQVKWMRNFFFLPN